MRWTILIPLVTFAALAAEPATASVSDFRLPGASPQQTQPDRQGPVVPDVPESRGPRPTPTPTSRTPAPAPTATTTPIEVPDISAATPAPSPAQTVRRDSAAPRSSPTVAAPADVPTAETGSLAQPADTAAPPTQAAAAPVERNLAPEEGGNSTWLWLLAGLAAVSALGFAGLVWWRQRPVIATPAKVPNLERPRLAPDNPLPEPEAAPVEPLQITLEPLRLSLTLMNATLAYRLEVANRGPTPIAALRIGADMISAHASMTREQQLSGPGDGAVLLEEIERLEPGESRIVQGEFRLPFPQIVPIRQGNAALLLPLARFRLQARGAAPVVRTFVVGQPGVQDGLQPFRLDLGPRIYPKLAQRAFA